MTDITGNSLSEALIFASTNPQYDDRFSIHENSKLKAGENMLCTEIVSDIQNNFCTQHVLPMFCKRRASDKDLPIQRILPNNFQKITFVYKFLYVSSLLKTEQ